MKSIKICLAVFLLLILSACNMETNNSQTSDGTKNDSDSVGVRDHQSLTSNAILNPNLSANNWMTIDLPEIGLKNLTFGRIAEGYVTKKDMPLPVYIFCDYARYDNRVYHYSYLAVATDSKILFKDLADGYDSGSYEDILYVLDVDGDGIDEIVVQQNVGMSGGAGQYLSRIFKVVNDEIREIFNSTMLDPSGDGWSVFDTGFTSEFLNGYKLKISNTITGYSTIIDISKKYIDDFFDENGKGKRNISISCDSFMEFKPEDVDGDGVFEIACLQYVSLDGHSDGVGYVKSILKSNPQTQKFEVIQTAFIAVE